MKKKELDGFKHAKATKIPIYKQGTKQRLYSLRTIIFDPDKCFVGTDIAKEHWRITDKVSKKKMSEEFCSIFAESVMVGKGRNKHLEFNKTTKTAVDTIFIVPNKYRREAYKVIQELELFVSVSKK